MQGIINKPKDLIMPIFEYKFDSREINNALSSGNISSEIQKKIDAIIDYLNLFKVSEDFQAYRGDITFKILNSVTTTKGRTLGVVLNKFTKNIKHKYKYTQFIKENFPDFLDVCKSQKPKKIFSEDEIKEFVISELIGIGIQQVRFGSIAMLQSSIKDYAKKISWTITIPAGTKGASIESFNVERFAESEFLANQNFILRIINAKYDIDNDLWEFEALLENVDKIQTDVSME